MTTHRYADWDAAYVLGALSSTDRREYEAHLGGCPTCRDAVAELAGMPGLLGAVEPVEVLALDAPASPTPRFEVIEGSSDAPEYLNAGEAEREGERKGERNGEHHGDRTREHHGRSGRARRWLAVAAAVVALGGAGVGGYTISEARQPATAVVTGPTRLAFSPVAASTMTAVVDVAPVGDRTSIKVECQYSGYAQDTWADYSVWAVDRDGHAGLVTTWRARPDLVMHPAGTAPVPLAQIAAIEIRRADSGQTVMRAALG